MQADGMCIADDPLCAGPQRTAFRYDGMAVNSFGEEAVFKYEPEISGDCVPRDVPHTCEAEKRGEALLGAAYTAHEFAAWYPSMREAKEAWEQSAP